MARFISADSEIQDPTHSQSYNRYSYVWNNPTNLTDPTGFDTTDTALASGHFIFQDSSGGLHDVNGVFDASGNLTALDVGGANQSADKTNTVQGQGSANGSAKGVAEKSNSSNGGTGGNSTSDQVSQLKKAQDDAMKDPALQPGARGAASHCSEATCDIARATGANSNPLGPENGGFYNANTQAENLSKAANDRNSGWKKIDLPSAQAEANKGNLVVVTYENQNGGSGHTVTVRPDDNNKNPSKNPSMAQVGGSTGNGVMPFRNTFGADKRDNVQVYVYVGH